MSVLQGGYEDIENRIILNNLRPHERVLELGAGIGFNSIAIARRNDSRILSFEANSHLLPIIRENQKLNGVSFEVRNHILVCDAEKERGKKFYVANNACMSSPVNANLPGFELKEVLKVKTENLESVLKEWQPGFLIVDIEGGEEELFKCPSVLADSSVNKILVEIHEEIIGSKACSEIIRHINSAGFNLIADQCKNQVYFFTRP